MKSELELYKEAHSHLFRALNEVASRAFIDKVFEEVNAILHPDPAYEEVPVERWFNPKNNHYREVEPTNWEDRGYIKLSGTLRRPLPRPVERSAKIQINNSNGIAVVQRKDSSDLLELVDKCGYFTWVEGER